MTDHSPDHAERAREVLERAVSFMRHSQLCGVVGGYNRCTCGMEEARDAALRGRDRVVEAEDLTAIDAILNRWRLNSDAARPSIKLGLLRRLRAAIHDAKVMREEQPAAADNPATGDSR